MSIYEKFKPTPLSTIKERKEEVATVTNQYEGDNNEGRLRRKSITEDGSYTIRMYPAHPGKGAVAIEPKVIYFLPGWVNKKDENGKWIEKPGGGFEKVKGVRPVFNAKVHGQSDYDLVDTYISLVNRKADQLYPDAVDEQDKKKYLLPIQGSFAPGSKYRGINPIRTFLFYGDLITGTGDDQKKEFYEFEVKPSVQKQLQKIAAMEAGDDPLGTDGCFTDPEDGRAFRIVVDSVGSKAANDPTLWYSVSILNEATKEILNGRPVSVLKSYPLSEEDLVKYEKVEPLLSYRTAFKWTDLKIQLEGLQMFDEEHGYGILDEDEFKEVYAYLEAKFPQEEEDSAPQADSTSSSSSKNQDVLDLMDLKELKAYIKDNKLSIVVLPRYSEEDLRELIREVESVEEEAEEIDSSEEEQNTSSEEGKLQDNDLSARLAKLRSNIGK